VAEQHIGSLQSWSLCAKDRDQGEELDPWEPVVAGLGLESCPSRLVAWEVAEVAEFVEMVEVEEVEEVEEVVVLQVAVVVYIYVVSSSTSASDSVPTLTIVSSSHWQQLSSSARQAPASSQPSKPRWQGRHD